MNSDAPTISSLVARAVNVPMRRPLATSGGTVATAPLVLIDLKTEQRITGSSYIFCYTTFALKPIVQLIHELATQLIGDQVIPRHIEQKLQRSFRLLGPQGFTGMAAAGIDMAAWDVAAKTENQSLTRFLGGEASAIPAYNSNGLGIIGAKKAAVEAVQLVDEGFNAIKVRLGYDTAAMDLQVIDSVRESVPAHVQLMTDYNQSLSVTEAVRRCQILKDTGLVWVEEPTTAEDHAGHAKICNKSTLPIQLGENCWGSGDMAKALNAGACDYFMADVVKIGGVSGWLRAMSLAESLGTPLSSHLFPEISAHLLALSPSTHWLEYVDWANPILNEPIEIDNGQVTAMDLPGIGLTWNESAVANFLVS